VRALVRRASVAGVLLGAHAAAAQFVQQGAKLVGAGAAGPAVQGYSVTISADGTTLALGGWSDGASAGAAWVFALAGGVWSQQGGKLVGSGEVGAGRLGKSVALSADGGTAVVSGPYDDADAGAAWVFVRSGGGWSQQGAKLVGSGATGNAAQGWSAALSGDGGTALVGAPWDDGNAGAVWAFVRSGGVWSQQGAKLVGTGAAGSAYQGYSAALSADGSTAIVGGVGDDGFTGAAWVFVRSGGAWSQQGTKLVGSGAVGASYQGYSVAVAADGDTAVVGGYGDSSDTGAAWVFRRVAGTWSQDGPKLVGSDAVGAAGQGWSVAIAADGGTVAIGGPSDDGHAGAAWVWRRVGGGWVQQGAKLVGAGAVGAANSGAVAVSGDGTTVVLGGPYDDAKTGAAWVFAAPEVCGPPSVVVQPQSRTAVRGRATTLAVTAVGSAPLEYQWYEGSAGDTSTPVGADGASFTTPPLFGPAAFWVRVRNACGSADSDAATVAVGRPARRRLAGRER